LERRVSDQGDQEGDVGFDAPDTEFLQASAEQAQAQAAKARADTVLTVAKADQTRADTAKTLAEMDNGNREHVVKMVQSLQGGGIPDNQPAQITQ
jgi:hypothetical protein